MVVLTIEPMPGRYLATPLQRLRGLLKHMGRAWGWKCITCVPTAAQDGPERAARTAERDGDAA